MTLQKMSEVQLPPEELRFSTGIGGLDKCLAESDDGPTGLPYGTSILLAGMPGGGKSTLATILAAAQTGRDALYLSGEERPERIRQRWDRLMLKDADPYVASLRAVEDALEIIRDLSLIKPLGVVIIDSVQCLTMGGKRKWDLQAEACEMLAGQICSVGGTALFVSQVSKSGNDHAGAASLSHMCDITIHLTSNAKKSERVLEVRKNRMGRAGFQVPLNVLQNGLSVGVPAPLGVTAAGLARTQLEKCIEVAYTQLMTGKRLDGYDMDLAGTPNGGIWRAGLEMAAKRLVRDGFEMVQEKVKSRLGWRMLNPPATGGETVVVVSQVQTGIELATKPTAPMVPPAPVATPVAPIAVVEQGPVVDEATGMSEADIQAALSLPGIVDSPKLPESKPGDDASERFGLMELS